MRRGRGAPGGEGGQGGALADLCVTDTAVTPATCGSTASVVPTFVEGLLRDGRRSASSSWIRSQSPQSASGADTVEAAPVRSCPQCAASAALTWSRTQGSRQTTRAADTPTRALSRITEGLRRRGPVTEPSIPARFEDTPACGCSRRHHGPASIPPLQPIILRGGSHSTRSRAHCRLYSGFSLWTVSFGTCDAHTCDRPEWRPGSAQPGGDDVRKYAPGHRPDVQRLGRSR